jgi:hypothetical protein
MAFWDKVTSVIFTHSINYDIGLTGTNVIVYDTIGVLTTSCHHLLAVPATNIVDVVIAANGDMSCDGVTITNSNSIRIGPPFQAREIAVDFGNTKCKAFGTTDLTYVPGSGSTPNKCAGHDLNLAFVTPLATGADNGVGHFNSDKIIVDLHKFQCFSPWDCTPHPMKIDFTRWGTALVDRKTDEHLYLCKFYSVESATEYEEAAKDYILIGDPTKLGTT